MRVHWPKCFRSFVERPGLRGSVFGLPSYNLRLTFTFLARSCWSCQLVSVQPAVAPVSRATTARMVPSTLNELSKCGSKLRSIE
jgi:hypothetical protein